MLGHRSVRVHNRGHSRGSRHNHSPVRFQRPDPAHGQLLVRHVGETESGVIPRCRQNLGSGLDSVPVCGIEGDFLAGGYTHDMVCHVHGAVTVAGLEIASHAHPGCQVY